MKYSVAFLSILDKRLLTPNATVHSFLIRHALRCTLSHRDEKYEVIAILQPF